MAMTCIWNGFITAWRYARLLAQYIILYCCRHLSVCPSVCRMPIL